MLTASAGNMAQGVAWCARQARVPCTVIAPDSAPRTKIAAVGNLDLDRFAELVVSVRAPQQHRVEEE